ncbi:selenocysteine lyase isoform X2 [Phycodurus eques]|uniref:selenocysteine lyase isoform X2 n=1 Tax=Phycodurus eques TaxID=693459 RepID=UPI002ACD5F42|nr:selenocysteine lyase isoform X2 [Phycodurus eques]
MANQCDAFPGHGREVRHTENSHDRIYMDYNATTPVAPEVIQATNEALWDAWGNPSSSYVEGMKAKALITRSRENVARMVGGNPEDIFFTSGGTESNNMVLHSAVEHFREQHGDAGEGDDGNLPHIISCNVEHDSVKLVAEHLKKKGKADWTCVPVSKVTGRVEADDVVAAVRPTTCLVSIMLANNETGIIMPVGEISERVRSLKQQDKRVRVLIHTDAAQALGKIPVDVKQLGVDYLTVVGHKFYGPRIGALFVNGPGVKTPLHAMLIGGGQERNFRPGTENTPMIAGLGKAAELVTAHLSDYESHTLDIREYLEERLKAFPHPPELRRGPRGGVQRPEAERGPQDQQRGRGRGCGRPPGGRQATGARPLKPLDRTGRQTRFCYIFYHYIQTAHFFFFTFLKFLSSTSAFYW